MSRTDLPGIPAKQRWLLENVSVEDGRSVRKLESALHFSAGVKDTFDQYFTLADDKGDGDTAFETNDPQARQKIVSLMAAPGKRSQCFAIGNDPADV